MSTPYPPQPRRLMRDPSNKLIGGVCSGLAKYLNMDVNLVRILAVVISLFTGIPIVLYLIALFVMPEERNAPQPPYVNGPQPGAVRTRGVPAAHVRTAQPAGTGRPAQPPAARPSAVPAVRRGSSRRPRQPPADVGEPRATTRRRQRRRTGAPVRSPHRGPRTSRRAPEPEPTPESEAPQPRPTRPASGVRTGRSGTDDETSDRRPTASGQAGDPAETPRCSSQASSERKHARLTSNRGGPGFTPTRWCPGGLLVMSTTTRFTSRTSLVIRVLIRSSSS